MGDHTHHLKRGSKSGDRRLSPQAKAVAERLAHYGEDLPEACAQVGCGLARMRETIRLPHAQAYLRAQQAQALDDLEIIRPTLQVLAYKEAMRLLREAKSETVRMQAVQFLIGARTPTSAPNDTPRAASDVAGYDYSRTLGQGTTIDGKAGPAPDSPSGGREAQPIVRKGH